MAKTATCRACGEEFEKGAPAQRYCTREVCTSKREMEAAKPATSKPGPVKKTSKKAAKKASTASKTAGATAAGPKATNGAPTGRVARAERLLALLGGEIEEAEAELERHEAHLGVLYDSANRIATSVGLKEPYVD